MPDDRLPDPPVLTDVDAVAPDLDALQALLSVSLQPIIRVATGDLFAYEALARFGDRSPEEVIAEAETLGRGVELELLCLRAVHRRSLELSSRTPISVNVGPQALRAALEHLDEWPQRLLGLIIEVTEHTTMSLSTVDNELAELRVRGAQLAVDDVGTGYAGLLRIATVRPDLVKVDKSIVTGVAGSAVQSAVLESLVTYSQRIGARVIAEGVETEEDLRALASFDVDFAQGWLIGRPQLEPGPVPAEVVALCRRNRADVLSRAKPMSEPADRTRTMNEVTSTLALASEFAEIRLAISRATEAMGLDNIALSGLDVNGDLREMFASGADFDAVAYRVQDYPTTARALATGETAEVHLSDSDGDGSEQELLRRIGAASLLIVPIFIGQSPIGIVEFYQRLDRRWTSVEIEQARGLALHVSAAWMRMLSNA